MKVFVDPKALEGAPDASAMAQAMYARSFVSIEDRLQSYIDEASLEAHTDGTPADPLAVLREKLNQFYVGYGHQSIAQTGSITLFIEGVNLQVAKLIEDHPLYNGQETSTRAVSFDGDDCLADQENITEYQTEFLGLYRRCFDLLANKLLPAKYPEYTEASVRARAFDIARNLLPVGVKTNLSWHTTLDNFNVQMERLTSYIWIDAVADAIATVFAVAYTSYSAAIVAPASWELEPACTGETVEHLQQRVLKHLKRLREVALHGQLSADSFIGSIRQPLQLAHNYANKPRISVEASKPFDFSYGGADINSHVTSILNLKSTNPHNVNRECGLPYYKLRLGGNGGDRDSATLRVSGVTSFATYRDTHRHRTLNPSVPIILPTVIASVWDGNDNTDKPYSCPVTALVSPWFVNAMHKLRISHPDYKEEIAYILDSFFATLNSLLHDVSIDEDNLWATFEENNLRYADFPLATCLPYTLTGTAKNFLHFFQLRAGETVHPELRSDIYSMVKRKVGLVVYSSEWEDTAVTHNVPLQIWLAAYTDWNQENWRRFNRNIEILKHNVGSDLHLITPSTRRGNQNIK